MFKAFLTAKTQRRKVFSSFPKSSLGTVERFGGPIQENKHMRSRYKIFKDNALYFVTSTTIEWASVFTNEKYYNILIEAIKFYQAKNILEIFAYVILPNHFHLILRSKELMNIMKLIKMYSAKQIIKQLKDEKKIQILKLFQLKKKKYKTKSNYQVWQEGCKPKEISSDNMLRQKIDYIHYNPVKKGLVSEPTDWKYSSAGFYEKGVEGVIKIDMIN